MSEEDSERVFIVTADGSFALRRGGGHVVHSILTHFADNKDVVPVALAGTHGREIQQKYPTLTPAAPAGNVENFQQMPWSSLPYTYLPR